MKATEISDMKCKLTNYKRLLFPNTDIKLLLNRPQGTGKKNKVPIFGQKSQRMTRQREVNNRPTENPRIKPKTLLH